VGEHPSPILVLEFIVSVIPFSLMFTIPFSFLAAIMLVFGRLSADNEILSMRMSGHSLPRIALPVFVVAAILSVFGYWLNAEIAPRAKSRVRNLLYEAVKEDPNKFLDPGVVQTKLKDKRIYVRERVGDNLFGLHIHDIQAVDKNQASSFYVYAESALIYVDINTSQIKLKLSNAFALQSDNNGTKIPLSVSDVDPVIFSFENDRKRRVKASSMTSSEIREYLKQNPDLPNKDRAKFSNAVTSRQSFSLACFAFALIGIPLGINARRKDSSTGFVLSIAIGMGYFIFHIFAGQIKDETSNLSTILFWLPNLLALILGLWLFRRARSK